MAVCDGIGGLEHGEIASSFVRERIAEWYDSITEWIDIESSDRDIVFSHLKDGAEDWNRALYDFRCTRNLNTGTTMSIFMLIGKNYYTIQVGDSRAYRYYDKELIQITVDDSITKLKNGKLKSYLSNYMGKTPELWYTCRTGIINKRELFFVCSDGFYHRLKLQDVEDIFLHATENKDLDPVCNSLVYKMMERGERDNISVSMVYTDAGGAR